MLLDINYEVSITDLVQTIGVCMAFPTAAWGIVKLFKKDKDKAEQLSALNDIAISQNSMIGAMKEQITELSNQTAQFEYQSFLFKESNDLLKQQIDIQTKALLNDKDYKDKYLQLEQKKRKSEILPFFRINGGYAGGSSFSLPLINLGERAYFKGVEEIDTNKININRQSVVEKVIGKNEFFTFQANSNDRAIIGFKVPFEINLLFSDEDGNQYKQKIKGSGSLAKIETPVERE